MPLGAQNGVTMTEGANGSGLGSGGLEAPPRSREATRGPSEQTAAGLCAGPGARQASPRVTGLGGCEGTETALNPEQLPGSFHHNRRTGPH